MAAAIPKQSDCCHPCDNSSSGGGGSNVPGPQGPAGAAGANGTDGDNAFSVTTSPAVIPPVGDTVILDVNQSEWVGSPATVLIEGAGYFLVIAKSPTAIEVENLGYPSNVAAGNPINTGAVIAPGGERGEDGTPAVPPTINDVSPTTTKGDIMVDNGANSPDPNVVRLAAGTDGQVVAAVAGQPTGLEYRTIAPNTATDNAIARFNGAAGTPVPTQNSLLIITDDGAIQSTPTGGNARGTKATDLQVDRSAANQVASGTNSVIAGGRNNRASGANSAICGGGQNVVQNANAFVGGGTTNEVLADNASICAGNTNLANAAASFIGGGDNNVTNAANASVCGGTTNNASGINSAIAGGSNNAASGTNSTIGAGAQNLASGTAATIPGGLQAEADKYGQLAHASGAFSLPGDCQASWLNWRIGTTDATANVEMFLDGSAQRATIPSDTSWGFHILLVGRDGTGADALWEVKGLIKNNGGTTSLTGSVTQTVIADGTGATWGVSGSVVVDADNGNDALRIRVTGAAATVIRWHAHARLVELGL